MAVPISGDGMWIFAFNLGRNHSGKCESVYVMELMSRVNAILKNPVDYCSAIPYSLSPSKHRNKKLFHR